MKLLTSHSELVIDPAFVALPPELQNQVRARLEAVSEIHCARNKDGAVRAIARRNGHRRGWGCGTLRNLYYSFVKNPTWLTLLDKARAGAAHWNTLDGTALPKEFCDFIGSQWSHRQRSKFRAAWVDLKAQYRNWRDDNDQSDQSKFAIAGYDRCPEPRPDTGLPDGWSENNLRKVAKKHTSRAARKLINIGPKAARAEFGYSAPTTRFGLEVGEVVMPDDCKNDFKILWRGKSSELWSLHILDLASGCNVMRGHKPTWLNEDDVKESLRESDMLFLSAAYLSNIGFHPNGTTWFCERSAATFRKDDVAFYDQLTDGKVRFKISPQGGGPGISGLFTGRGGGLPSWKASLESWFNLFHNRCDNMLEFPGQTGSLNRVNKPEGLSLMERTDEALFKAMQFLTPERQQLIRFNLLQFPDAAPALDLRAEFCNTRRDHDLEGWDECKRIVPGFRLHNKMDFIPFSKTEGMAADDMERLRRLLTTSPDLTGEVRLSPREVFDAGAKKLRKFSPAMTAMLLARCAGKERPVKRGVIEFELPEVNQSAPCVFGPVIKDFKGTERTLSQDEKYNVRVNPYDPRFAWLYSAKDGFCGVARRQAGKGTKLDETALHEHFKNKARVMSGIVAEARQLAAPITARAAEILDNNAAVMAAEKNQEEEARQRFEKALLGK